VTEKGDSRLAPAGGAGDRHGVGFHAQLAMAKVRTNEPQRAQGVIRFEIPEETLPADHRARLLWRIVERLDLTAFLAEAKAFEGQQGRDQTSVRMLLTLWLYAISVNVGSGREIERRLGSDPAFQWIVGDKRVGRTRLNEFRTSHPQALEKVFKDVLGVLMSKGLVSLDLVAQDGTRVRASASGPSFRRAPALADCRRQAALHLRAVLAQADEADDVRQQKAREAKARDYQRRVDEAIDVVCELQEANFRDKEVRSSTTDAEARVMKMPGGGFFPAYNVQLATAGDPEGGPRTIVGVRVTNVGSDYGSVGPMLDDIERKCGARPSVLLADAGHASIADIDAAHERGVTALIAPWKKAKTSDPDDDSAAASWLKRMRTDEAKQQMRARPSLCELSNAHIKTRFAMASLLVRGLTKVTCMVLLTALTANLVAHAAFLAS
jgi:transposase